jgi:flagellar biosynthesis protein FlhG
MNDQAQRLRDLVQKTKKSQQNLIEENNIPKKRAKIICVTSGKGGVGKSNFTTNVAVNLSKMGKKVVLLDADFGLANIDVLFGMSSKYNLTHVINGTKTIEEILTTGPNNIKFISGGSGMRELIYLEKGMLDNFVNGIKQLDEIADIIIVDTGAGISDTVVSFILAADEIVLVTTPEPTAITDAYALIKTIVNLENTRSINLVVNRSDNKNEAEEVYSKINGVCERFLNFKLNKLGFIANDPHVSKAVKMQKPFSMLYPDCAASRTVLEVTRNLMSKETPNSESEAKNGLTKFLNRFLSYIK